MLSMPGGSEPAGHTLGHTVSPAPAPGRSLQSKDPALLPSRTCSDPSFVLLLLQDGIHHTDKIPPFSCSLIQAEAVLATSQPDITSQLAPAGEAAGSSCKRADAFLKVAPKKLVWKWTGSGVCSLHE